MVGTTVLEKRACIVTLATDAVLMDEGLSMAYTQLGSKKKIKKI